MAMSKESTSLQCSICMSDFKDPRILGCFHTFCSLCLVPIIKKWAKRTMFPCPLCRVDTDIPSNGVMGFQKNFYICQDAPKAGPTSCGFCDKGKAAIAKCIDCEEILCGTCRTIHGRMSVTKGHSVVALRSSDAGVPCDIHRTHKVYIYCTLCKQKLCVKCKEELHIDHDVDYISVAAERERLNMKQVAENAQEFLGLIEDTITDAHTEYKRTNKDITAMKHAASDHAEKMKLAVDQALHGFIKHLDSDRKLKKHKLQTFVLEVEDKREAVRGIIESITGKLQDESDVDILERSRPIMHRLLRVVRERIEFPCEEQFFFPCEIPTRDKEIMGTVFSQSRSTISIPSPSRVLYVPMFEIKAISSFKSLTGDKRVTSIAPISGTFAWLCYNHGKTIYLCDKDGTEKKQITLPGRVEGISVSREGYLIITSYHGNVLWRVDKTYTGIIGEDTFEYQPRNVCWGSNGLYCTLVKVVSILNIETNAKLVKFNKDMSIAKITPTAENSEPIIKNPKGISEHANGDLVVQNWSASNSAEVVVFAPNLAVMRKHRCETIADDDLKPTNVCCDVYGNTFVIDPEKGYVYLLNQKFDRFQAFLGPDHGVRCPVTMAIDGLDHMWVGDSETGTTHVFRYIK